MAPADEGREFIGGLVLGPLRPLVLKLILNSCLLEANKSATPAA